MVLVEVFNGFFSSFTEILKKIEPSCNKSGLSNMEGFALIAIFKNIDFYKFLNEDIIDSLKNKGLILTENSAKLTGKGGIIAKSIAASI